MNDEEPIVCEGVLCRDGLAAPAYVKTEYGVCPLAELPPRWFEGRRVRVTIEFIEPDERRR